jgi:hypothetical protein
LSPPTAARTRVVLGHQREGGCARRHKPPDLAPASEDLVVAVGSRHRGGSRGVVHRRPSRHTSPRPCSSPSVRGERRGREDR